MAHKYFHLHKRPSKKKGKYIYYVQFYDEYGNRLTAKSTGMTSKAAAENWSYEQLRKGLVFVNKKITFNEYARNWWIWEKCQYIKRKLVLGKGIKSQILKLSLECIIHLLAPPLAFGIFSGPFPLKIAQPYR